MRARIGSLISGWLSGWLVGSLTERARQVSKFSKFELGVLVATPEVENHYEQKKPNKNGGNKNRKVTHTAGVDKNGGPVRA